MTLTILRRLFLASAGYVLLCIPAILASERHWIPVPQSFFHVSQFAACVVTLATAAAYLAADRAARRHRTDHPDAEPSKHASMLPQPRAAITLAWIAVVLVAVWLAFIAVVMVIFALAMRDFDR